MATKKQQRRKYKRAVAHGRVPGDRDPADGVQAPSVRQKGRPGTQKPVMLGAKEIKPPSYLRAARRALIMSVLLWAGIQFISIGSGPRPSVIQAAFQAAVFFCWLTPFGYFMDWFIYRRALKRQRQG
jgi:hypothetical protein